ncbi:MAG: D-sedoheptulose 7-phosphate isomerase [Bacteroidota bacterium]|nr:D-sedoheptulose 7-phosphate isomerase [Bacteroidota bacterium]MEC8802245.1 D-sedoheptulose 7-phosphate isomerase [Bacteroidota bacterium]
MNTIFERMKLRDHFEEGANLADAVLRDEAFLAAMERGAQLLVEALGSGHKILSCGNGGSMCDAMHFAEELSGRYRDDRKPFAALSLSDPSAMTCIGNDYGFEQVFARQTQALGQAGDVLLAISTSGNSANVLAAATQAKALGMGVLALTGNDGGKLAGLADVEVRVPWSGYADRIQEVHIRCIHAWIHAVEQQLT